MNNPLGPISSFATNQSKGSKRIGNHFKKDKTLNTSNKAKNSYSFGNHSSVF